MGFKRAATMAGGILAVAGLTLGACGDDDDGGDADAVVDMLVESGDANQQEAECLVDELGAGKAEELLLSDAELSSEDELDSMLDALSECGVE